MLFRRHWNTGRLWSARLRFSSMTGKASESTQKERGTIQEAGMLENALQYWKSSPDPQHRLDLLKTFRLALVENQYVYALTVQQSNYPDSNTMWNTLVSTRSTHKKPFTLYPAAFHEGGVVYIAFLNREKALRYAQTRKNADIRHVPLESLLEVLASQSDLEGLYVDDVDPHHLILSDELNYILQGTGHSPASSSISGELLVQQVDPAMLHAQAIVRCIPAEKEYDSDGYQKEKAPAKDGSHSLRAGRIEVSEGIDDSCTWWFTTMCPSYDPMDGELSLTACYWNALETAARMQLTSIAIPLIGYPDCDYPLEICTKSALSTCAMWLRQHPHTAIKIVLTAASDEEFRSYDRSAKDLYAGREQSAEY